MADAPNTVSTLNGNFKEVYGDKYSMPIPSFAKVQKMIPFVAKEKQIGNSYHVPVMLAYENGFSYATASSGAFTLNDAVASVSKDASATGSQILLRSQLDYESAARAVASKSAFVDATELVLESMLKATTKRVEGSLLWGQTGIGTVSSVSGTAPAYTIVITLAEFAPAIWHGAEGAVIEFSNSAISANRGYTTISSVNIESRTIVTTGGTAASVAAGDVIFFYGQLNGGTTVQEMAGMYKILSNTGSLFGISAATYSSWAATSVSAGGAMTFSKLSSAIASAQAKGLDGDVTFLCNPKTWGNIADTQTGNVRYTNGSGSKKYAFGTNELEFHAAGTKVSVVSTPFMKEGYGMGLQLDTWVRGGAQDIDFKTPGSRSDEIFFHLTTKAGFELRNYTNQFLMSVAPCHNFLVTGIVNS